MAFGNESKESKTTKAQLIFQVVCNKVKEIEFIESIPWDEWGVLVSAKLEYNVNWGSGSVDPDFRRDFLVIRECGAEENVG